MAGKSKGIYTRGRIYWISYVGLDGTLHRESTKSTKLKYAEAILTSRRNAVLEGKEPSVKKIQNPTFKELTDRYKEFIVPQKSYKVKCFNLNQLVREFGNLRLSEFSVELLERFQSKLITEGIRSESTRINNGIKPLERATANRLLATLKHSFTKAFDWGYCSETTLKCVRKVKLFKEDNARIRYLSVDECNDVLSACNQKSNSRYLKRILIYAIHTGCRKGEILNLKWENVDMKHSRITIVDTKNGEKRVVPIDFMLMEELKGIVRHLHSPYVFCDAAGKQYKGERISKLFKTVCNRAGIDDFRFHDLRHTYASQFMMAGGNLVTLSKLLGHKTFAMTLRYSHLAEDYLENAANLLANRLNGGSSQLLHNSAVQ